MERSDHTITLFLFALPIFRCKTSKNTTCFFSCMGVYYTHQEKEGQENDDNDISL